MASGNSDFFAATQTIFCNAEVTWKIYSQKLELHASYAPLCYTNDCYQTCHLEKPLHMKNAVTTIFVYDYLKQAPTILLGPLSLGYPSSTACIST